MEITTQVSKLKVSDYQADDETLEANGRRMIEAERSGYREPCVLCGRPLSEKAIDSAWWVELGDGGSTILPNGHHLSDDETMGCFPMGSECAKRIPKTHKWR